MKTRLSIALILSGFVLALWAQTFSPAGKLIPIYDAVSARYVFLTFQEFWDALTASGVTSGDTTRAGELQLREIGANGTDYASWLAPDALSVSVRYRMPATPPAAPGQVLTCGIPVEGVSTCSWAAQ